MNAVFALFPDETRAREAIDAVMSRAEIAPDVEGVIAHGGDGRKFRAREFIETDAGPALRNSLIIGVIGGAILGALLAGPFDLISGGLGVGIVLGAVLGSIFAIFGSIYGAGRTDRSLGRLVGELRDGQMLVTFKVRHAETEAAIREVVARFGARVTGKHLASTSAA